jgi:methylenetetrahydrofolate dehydrogenase (NADP+)/methenyltetrahydrofolate cyclohydrolase
MLIDGKKIALEIQAEIKSQVEKKQGRKPGLVFILVGDHPASLSYIRGKRKACQETGIHSSVIEFPASAAEKNVLLQIEKLNLDPLIDGILVQLPLPLHMDQKKITSAIDPTKDVDGFHPINVGKMLLGEDDGFFPCTPKGICVLLQKYQIPTLGKHVVIAGRSNIVGKPLAAMMMQKKIGCNATVTIVHSKSERLKELIFSADIVVAAIGNPLFIKQDMIQPGSTVIDVGINRMPNGKLIGDVDFQSVSKIAGFITPVPGGVGPMTIAMLMQNTLESYEKRSNDKNDLF